MTTTATAVATTEVARRAANHRSGAARSAVNLPAMKIVLNGEPREVTEGISVVGLLEAADYVHRRVAVEVNREIVPKSRHGERILREGDRIEIVHAMGGG